MAAPAESALILAVGMAAAGVSYVLLGGANHGAKLVRAQSGKPLPGMEAYSERPTPTPALTEKQALLRLVESPESCCYGGPN